jgi:hypothetical protein
MMSQSIPKEIIVRFIILAILGEGEKKKKLNFNRKYTSWHH